MEIRGFTIKYSKRKAKKLLHKKVSDLQVRAENNLHNRNMMLDHISKNHVDENQRCNSKKQSEMA